MTREEKISRLKDILAEINKDKDAVCYLTSEDNELIKSAIKALEQELKSGQWIPISERSVSEELPEEFQRVLVTIVNYNGDKVVRVAEYYSQKGIFRIKENNEQWKVGEKGLLAWRPLPEPYEPQGK